LNQKSKKILLVVSILILFIPVGFYVFIQYVFDYSNDHYTVKTEYGDQFDVEYDGYKCRSNISCSDSEFSLTLNGKINKEDFVGLKHTESVTIYALDGPIIFNKGGGFKEFNSETIDSNKDIAEHIIAIIMSDASIFGYNLNFFLKSSIYGNEAQQIIECIKQKKYDKLSIYGLTDEIINDGHTLNSIQYEVNRPRK